MNAGFKSFLTYVINENVHVASSDNKQLTGLSTQKVHTCTTENLSNMLTEIEVDVITEQLGAYSFCSVRTRDI